MATPLLRGIAFYSIRCGLLASLAISQRHAGAAAPSDKEVNVAATEKQRDYEQYALTHSGDAGRGQEWFTNEKLTKCALCHKIHGHGGDVGPDLSHIGGKFDRPHLVESLLEPSRQIVEGFRTSIVVLADGRTLTGIVREQSPEKIALFDAGGIKHVVATADVEERQPSPVSLMPHGLEDLLTREQFTDLIAYLDTLRAEANAPFGAAIRGPIVLPEAFEVRTVCTGLTGCTAMEVSRDGRVFVCEQRGTLRVVKGGELLARPFVTLPVDPTWERGLIGVTVDPGFPEVPFVYVCYVAKEPYPHHRVSRLTADGELAAPASEQVLLEGDDQRKLGGNVPAGHQGGAIHFGPDGKLYIAIGEQTAETPAQELTTFQGKMLRTRASRKGGHFRHRPAPARRPALHRRRPPFRAVAKRLGDRRQVPAGNGHVARNSSALTDHPAM